LVLVINMAPANIAKIPNKIASFTACFVFVLGSLERPLIKKRPPKASNTLPAISLSVGGKGTVVPTAAGIRVGIVDVDVISY